mgnify:CR=1 FL=1|jgi:predicted amino acid racemase
MAELIIRTKKIQHNILYLSQYLSEKNIHWSLITKVFSGDKTFLENVLTKEVIQHLNSIGDSRLTSLKNLKEVNPEMKTIYIKPPAEIYADEVIKYADISLNSSYETIKSLNESAKNAGKIHQVIIMIELGELREGVNRNDVMDFYEKIFELSNIEVIGLGSNLGCMYGIIPTYDKLLQLVLYKELISAKFNKELRFISGGSSITLPLLEQGTVPQEVNHYRIGEAAFFGISPFDNQKFEELAVDTFEFRANIIELKEKKMVPDGIMGDGNVGHTANYNQKDAGEFSIKAILDFGMLDVDRSDIEPICEDLSFVGITSDMLVVDLGENKDESGKQKYKVGDQIAFKPNYMAVARLLNSKFIDKVFE